MITQSDLKICLFLVRRMGPGGWLPEGMLSGGEITEFGECGDVAPRVFEDADVGPLV